MGQQQTGIRHMIGLNWGGTVKLTLIILQPNNKSIQHNRAKNYMYLTKIDGHVHKDSRKT